MKNDFDWMRIAFEEAILAKEKGEVPVGAVLIQNNEIISQAHNCPISTNDPSAHAEIMTLRKAGQKLKNYRFPEASLYVTLEPCIMCIGAINHARLKRVVFGAPETNNSIMKFSEKNKLNPYLDSKLRINGGVLENECKELLKSFFIMRRKEKLKLIKK